MVLSGATNNGFLLNTLKTLFRLSRVLLDPQKSIINGAVKFVSVRSSQGNLSLFEITRASVLFSRKFCMKFDEKCLTKVRHFLIPLSITFLNPKILGFLFFYEKSLTWKVKCENYTSESRREYIRQASKTAHEWNGPSRYFQLSEKETVLKEQKVLLSVCFSELEQIFERKKCLGARDVILTIQMKAFWQSLK